MNDDSLKELLTNFKELYDEGLITAAEYEQKKREVLDMRVRASAASASSAQRQYAPVPASAQVRNYPMINFVCVCVGVGVCIVCGSVVRGLCF